MDEVNGVRTRTDTAGDEIAHAGVGRRLGALAIDWGLCLAISFGFFAADPWATLGLFALENVLLVGTLGFTVGHRALSLRVQRLDGARAGLWRAALRSVLLCLVLPAAIWDADGRGMHDRLAGTVIVRFR